MSAAFAAKIWFKDEQRFQLPWWDLMLVGPASVGSVFGLVLVVLPARLCIDDKGATFIQVDHRKRVAWADVERVCISSGSISATAPFIPDVVRAIASTSWIGIDYKAGCNPIGDPAKATYRRGIRGFDVAWPVDFEHSASWIVDRMNERLSASPATPEISS